MNISEKKLDLFRKLDNLDNSKLEKVYDEIIDLINTDPTKNKILSPEIKSALDEGLKASEEGRVFSHEEVMRKTKQKFPKLFK